MENDEIKSKLKRFMAASIPIHIILKFRKDSTMPRFLNGLVIGEKPGDIFIVKDRKLGETYVFLEDIHDLRVFQKDNRTLANEIKNDLGFQFIGEGVSSDEIDLIKNIKNDEGKNGKNN